MLAPIAKIKSIFSSDKRLALTILTVGVLILSLASVFILLEFSKRQVQNNNGLQNNDIQQNDGDSLGDIVYLSVDTGLNLDDEGGSLYVYERYRLIDERLQSSDKTVNISSQNAQVTVTKPDGSREDVTSDLWFYSANIIPSSIKGTYKLSFALKNGEFYERTFQLYETANVSVLYSDGKLLLTDLDIAHASSAFHIFPDNAINLIEESELEFTELRGGRNIFLSKVDDRWRYAAINVTGPSEFEEISF